MKRITKRLIPSLFLIKSSADDIKQIAALLDDIEHKHSVKLTVSDAYLWTQIRLAVQFHRIVWYHIRLPYGHAACERCIELAENEKKKITRDAASA